jgi:hypothetical protein
MRGRFRPVYFACLAAVLTACSPQYVTVLRCEEEELDQNYRCQKIKKIGPDLEILINPTTQKVQITTMSDPGDWESQPVFLDNCSVVDEQNWNCKIETKGTGFTIVDRYAMHHGHFYRSMKGTASPMGYYSSSLSGWRHFAFKYGFLSAREAQLYE